jgi:hypothetical protein
VEEIYAWVVAVAAGLGVLLGILALTAFIANGWLRWLLRVLAAVWLLLPWPIQVVDGYYAPAIIVVIFEGLFNRQGDPWPPLTALGVASAVVVIVFLIGSLFRPRRAAAGGA